MRPLAERAEYRHRPASSNFSEYLQRGTEVIGAIQAGVMLGEVVLPSLRPQRHATKNPPYKKSEHPICVSKTYEAVVGRPTTTCPMDSER